jgi:hypothetical protein
LSKDFEENHFTKGLFMIQDSIITVYRLNALFLC